MRSRLLGVDYGLARVGIALSDPLGITAQPLTTLHRRGDKQICREIAQLVEQREVVEVIVGIPLEMSGDRGPAAELVERFVARLKNYLTVPVTLWDERLTSVTAERDLSEAGVKWRRRKKILDQVAAAIMLQVVLEHRRCQEPED